MVMDAADTAVAKRFRVSLKSRGDSESLRLFHWSRPAIAELLRKIDGRKWQEPGESTIGRLATIVHIDHWGSRHSLREILNEVTLGKDHVTEFRFRFVERGMRRGATILGQVVDNTNQRLE